MATTRTFNNKGIAALNANIVIPPSPIPGVAYRNDTFNQAANEVGEPFESVPNSANFNEQQFIITSFIKMLGEQGIVGWSDLTDYVLPAIVWASDGEFYTALQASGPGGIGAKDPISEPLFWELQVGGGIPLEYIQKIIENVGLTFVQGQFAQFMDALTQMSGGSTFYTSSGAANVYNLVLANGFTSNLITQYFDGLVVEFIPHQTNLAAATAQIGALGLKAIVDENENPLISGELRVSTLTKMVYKSSINSFKLLRPTGTPVIEALINSEGDLDSVATGIVQGNITKGPVVIGTQIEWAEIDFPYAFATPTSFNIYMSFRDSDTAVATVASDPDQSDATKIRIVAPVFDNSDSSRLPEGGFYIRITRME